MVNRDNEYNALHSEMQIRINNLYNHNYTIVTLIVAVWAFIISAYISCLRYASAICAFVAIIPMCISFIVIILMQQWNENLMGLGQISAYLIAFYEIPSLHSKQDKTSKLFWETHSTSNKFMDNRTIWYSNKSYLLVSLASVILSWALGIHSAIYNGFQKWHSIILICLLAVCLPIYIWLLVRVKLNIVKFKLNEIFTDIVVAVNMGTITRAAAKEYLDTYLFCDCTAYLSCVGNAVLTSKQKALNKIKSTDTYKNLMEFLNSEETNYEAA